MYFSGHGAHFFYVALNFFNYFLCASSIFYRILTFFPSFLCSGLQKISNHARGGRGVRKERGEGEERGDGEEGVGRGRGEDNCTRAHITNECAYVRHANE